MLKVRAAGGGVVVVVPVGGYLEGDLHSDGIGLCPDSGGYMNRHV